MSQLEQVQPRRFSSHNNFTISESLELAEAPSFSNWEHDGEALLKPADIDEDKTQPVNQRVGLRAQE